MFLCDFDWLVVYVVVVVELGVFVGVKVCVEIDGVDYLNFVVIFVDVGVDWFYVDVMDFEVVIVDVVVVVFDFFFVVNNGVCGCEIVIEYFDYGVDVVSVGWLSDNLRVFCWV